MEIGHHYSQARMKINVVHLVHSIYTITCAMLTSNIDSASLILTREGDVGLSVISLSLDVSLLVSDVLPVLAGTGDFSVTGSS